MKATLVLNDTPKRVVYHVDDGTIIEISANPKTGIVPQWAKYIANEPYIHLHVENAAGYLLTPGKILGRKKRFPVFWFLILVLVLGYCLKGMLL